MAGLFDFVASLADDDTCMRQLSDACGLDSIDAGRRAYVTATGLLERRLVSFGDDSVATKSLLRSVRSQQQAGRTDPRVQFETGDVVGDELVHDVFGSEADAAVTDLAAQLAISDDKARSVLESTTAVLMSSAAGIAGDDLTIESLAALLVADPDATPAELGSPGPRAVEVPGGEAEPGDDATGPAVGAASVVGARVATGSHRSRSKAWLVAVPVLVLLGAGAGWLTTRGGDDTTLAFVDEPTTSETDGEPGAQPATPTSTPAATGPDNDADDSAPTEDVSPGTGSEAPSDHPAGTDGEAASGDQPAAGEETADDGGPDPAVDVVSPPVPIGAPDNHAVMSQGRIFLRGYVESAEVEQLIVAAVEDVVGPGAVVSEYVIDPERAAADDDDATPVYIEDTVLFATGSAEIAPDFVPLLGAGLRLLQLQPGVTLEVTGHTDSEGSDEVNLALSQSRVDAVKDFFVAQGIDPERVIAIGKGETEPRADNATAEGRQANRRVEFLVKGFSYGP